MMLGPRPMMPMPGMPYHMGMSMPMSSIPSPAPAPMMGIKAGPCFRETHPLQTTPEAPRTERRDTSTELALFGV